MGRYFFCPVYVSIRDNIMLKSVKDNKRRMPVLTGPFKTRIFLKLRAYCPS